MRTHPNSCRCGHRGDGPHPCHYPADGVSPYTCRKPATQRFYNARPFQGSGTTMKLSVDDTWACDDCWAKHTAMMKATKDAHGNSAQGQ